MLVVAEFLLTEFHEDRIINVASRVKNASPLGRHVFQANVTIFELIQDINKTNLLAIFHEDWTINVASRVLTRKNAPPPGSHFHNDLTINLASRVLTRKNAPPLGGHPNPLTSRVAALDVSSRVLTRQMFTPHYTQPTKGDSKSSP
ncbi:hypothetical protein DPMN_095661 [Dreissena polymorpha]|uniref:Uncharacterized protein n=1 Tax=Dreissena polymorpha TaxID=45954 RepID=A0A9D4R331_DREPO|nr:hypothetical protein DPMN_095661 [Dreissena polymorpha]